MKPIFETTRLVARQMTMDDLDFIAAMLDDPEVMRFWPRPQSRAEAEQWIVRTLERYARDGFGSWLISLKDTGEPVGRVGLSLQLVEGVEEPEIGYIIHRPYWRRGFASEAAAATRDYAFDVLGKPYVISLIRPENLPSQGVARKIGLTTNGRIVPFGGFDHLVFSLTKADRRA